METIKEALMKWGGAILLIMENRGLFYSPVLHHWRVKKLVGADKKTFLYDGDDFDAAFDILLGPHAANNIPHGDGASSRLPGKEEQNAR